MYCAVFIRCTTAVTRCHSLPFVVIHCHSLHYSLSLFVTCCATRCHSLSLDVPLVCLFINDRSRLPFSVGYFIYFDLHVLVQQFINLFSSIKETNWWMNKGMCVLLFHASKHLLLRKTDVPKTCRKSKFLGKKICRNALALKRKKVQAIFGKTFRLQNLFSDFF